MVRDGIRVCDVCAGEIPNGEKYSVHTLPAEAAAMLLDAEDPDLVPSLTQNVDGTVRLDICTTCYLSMGPARDQEEQ